MFAQQYSAGRGSGGSPGLLDVFRQGWGARRSTSGALLATAALAAVGAAVLWLLQWSPLEDDRDGAPDVDGSARLGAASLHELLAELTRRLFHVTREVAAVARDLRAGLSARGQEIPDDILRSELARQCHISARFAQVRTELLAERNISEDTLTSLSEADSAAVLAHREGVEKMLKDALNGLQPLLPGVQIPSELTEDRVLEIHKEMLRRKIDKVQRLAAVTKEKRYSPDEIGRAAALISQAAEVEVLSDHQDTLGKEGDIYHSAMAQYGRDADFNARLAKLDAEHRQMLVAAFRNEPAQQK